MLNMKYWRKFRRNSNNSDSKNQLHKELLESGKLSDKFSKNLLKTRPEDFMQEIYLGYIYSRYRKIRSLDKYDPLGNAGQIQSSFKEFEKRIRWRWYSLKPERVGFEPTNSFNLLNDFESFAFDHSATSPPAYKYAGKKRENSDLSNYLNF